MQNRRKRVDWLLLDDAIACSTAKLLGLSMRSTSYLIVHRVKNGILEKSNALSMPDDLVKGGYRLSTTNYVEIREIISENL